MKTQPESAPQSLSIGQWLRRQPADLRSDCEYLLCAHLDYDRARLRRNDKQALSLIDTTQLDDLVKRLKDAEPLGYLLGEQPFHNIALAVDARVLVPRSDTETLVELALAHCQNNDSAIRVLDLGTGSGAIAIAMAVALPALNITATDISGDALAVAASNSSRWRTDVRLLESNWFDAVTGRFDLIVSNPPYIPANDPHLPSLHHEPPAALIAGNDGLADLNRIVSGAPKYLNNNGALMVEHGYDQALQVAALFTAAGFTSVRSERDLGNRPRVTAGQWCPA